MELREAAERPDEARTDSSAASSMSRRIVVTLRKTPGSMGGGVGLPGTGTGNAGGVVLCICRGGNEVNIPPGESGGV